MELAGSLLVFRLKKSLINQTQYVIWSAVLVVGLSHSCGMDDVTWLQDVRGSVKLVTIYCILARAHYILLSHDSQAWSCVGRKSRFLELSIDRRQHACD